MTSGECCYNNIVLAEQEDSGVKSRQGEGSKTDYDGDLPTGKGEEGATYTSW